MTPEVEKALRFVEDMPEQYATLRAHIEAQEVEIARLREKVKMVEEVNVHLHKVLDVHLDENARLRSTIEDIAETAKHEWDLWAREEAATVKAWEPGCNPVTHVDTFPPPPKCGTCGGKKWIPCQGSACNVCFGRQRHPLCDLHPCPGEPCPDCTGKDPSKCGTCGGSGEKDRFSLGGGVPCPDCTGKDPPKCGTCGGSGKAQYRVNVPPSRCGDTFRHAPCPDCGGTGKDGVG